MICLEYVWIDGLNHMRSKIKIVNNVIHTIEDVPIWNFDGSSTKQADGWNSDVMLKPVRLFNNPFIKHCKSFLVLCECSNKDETPHETNTRAECVKTAKLCEEHKPWFGIEQEYILFGRDDLPYKWKQHNEPGKGGQGPYYCGVGGDRSFGREISNEHMKLCMEAGVRICGTNAEVTPSQWEFQIIHLPPVEEADHLWMSRYILYRVTEKYGCYADLHPKPYPGHSGSNLWNGSGLHTNTSLLSMRQPGGIKYIYKACEKLRGKHKEHIAVYGKYNDERLTGKHETCSINEFRYGEMDRGASIRIPLGVLRAKCGYFEDRRPASNGDPYLIIDRILKTIILDQ